MKEVTSFITSTSFMFYLDYRNTTVQIFSCAKVSINEISGGVFVLLRCFVNIFAYIILQHYTTTENSQM